MPTQRIHFDTYHSTLSPSYIHQTLMNDPYLRQLLGNQQCLQSESKAAPDRQAKEVTADTEQESDQYSGNQPNIWLTDKLWVEGFRQL
jgi:hypothetical protein